VCVLCVICVNISIQSPFTVADKVPVIRLDQHTQETLGVKHVRGCEVFQVLDEAKTVKRTYDDDE